MSKQIILYDPSYIQQLYPLALTRSVADFRVGIFTIRSKWENHLQQTTQVLTNKYLQALYSVPSASAQNLYINAAVLPTEEIVAAIRALKYGQTLKSGAQTIAFSSAQNFEYLADLYTAVNQAESVLLDAEVNVIQHNWDVFKQNGDQIKSDVKLIESTTQFQQNALSNCLHVQNAAQVFVEKGAEVGACIFNASEGPIYIGKQVKVLDGAVLKGPIAICDNAVVKMSAKLYGETTIGPHCKVGGEISNSILFGYSNKGHDGYLGNSVIGEWCNLGADTNNSNLKNNYSTIKCWDYETAGYKNSGLQFCGLIMGDHAKSGINTMFNTGTVVGVAANVFGGGFPPKFIPSFSWGGVDGFTTFKLEKAYEMATNMMKRRKIEFSSIHQSIFDEIFKESSKFRTDT